MVKKYIESEEHRRVPIDPGTLASIKAVYSWSSWALLVCGILSALMACATVAAAYLQWKTSNQLDAYTDWRAESLELQTAEARRETSDALERISSLQTEAEKLKELAEADRLARIKIEQKLAPRLLTNKQQEAIIEKIKPFAPQQFEFVSHQDDPEVVQLVHTLVRLLIARDGKEFL
jgi:hypothetical protein